MSTYADGNAVGIGVHVALFLLTLEIHISYDLYMKFDHKKPMNSNIQLSTSSELIPSAF